MKNNQTVLILGGGVGGLVAARTLRKQLPRQHRIILIDREREHVFAPSLLWLMVGLRKTDAIKRPLARLQRKGIEVLHGEIQTIDPIRKAVTVSGKEILADHLIISLGAELAPETIPGLQNAGHNFYTLLGAESLHQSLLALKQGRIIIMTSAPGYKCPAAPYEAALLIDAYLRKRGLRESVSIDVYAAEPAPMGTAGPEISSAIKQLLAQKQIPYHPDHQVTSVDNDTKIIAFSNGVTAPFDLLAYVPPHRAPRVIRDSALIGDTGWISVDRNTLETQFPHIYAIGDVVSIPLKLGKPLPKAGVFAHGQAEVVAQNIASQVQGKKESAQFTGHGQCFIEIGDGKAGLGGGDFYAEPKPTITLHAPSWRWHAGKVIFEKLWFYQNL